MTKTILAALLVLGTAGAAFAEGEGFATTGDWREIQPRPASSAQGLVSQIPAPTTTASSSTGPAGVVVR